MNHNNDQACMDYSFGLGFVGVDFFLANPKWDKVKMVMVIVR